MNRQISQKEAIFRFTRAFLGQYLSTVHNFNSFQEEAINMLAHYLIQLIRSLAVRVMNLLKLQGRTLPNSLHLLVLIDQLSLMDFEELHSFIINRKEATMDTKSLDIIEKVGKKLFENDCETVNNYPKQKINPNIRYIPPAYVVDLNKVALPYKHSIDTAFEMPPQRTYRQTKEKITVEKKNIELLSAYTKRQNKIAITARMIDIQKDKSKKSSKENKDNINQGEEITGRIPEKKLKFSSIEYI